MKFRASILLLGLSLSFIPSIAATPPKAGALCSKLGATSAYKDKKYTCIKSGKKLVWNKGVQIKVAAPVPTSSPTVTLSPTPTPTLTPAVTPVPETTTSVKPSSAPEPTPSTNSEKWNKTDSRAIQTFELWSKNLALGNPITQVNYWFSSKISETLKNEAKRRMENAVLQWERFFKVKRTKPYFYIGLFSDAQPICEKIYERAPLRDIPNCLQQIKNSQSQLYYHATGWESEGGYMPVIDSRLSPNASSHHNFLLEDEEIFYASNFLPRIEHEWFHQIQFDLIGNNYVKELPCWFLEGSSEYFGVLSALGNKPDQFLQHRAQVLLWMRDDMTKAKLLDWITAASAPKINQSGFDTNCSQLDDPMSIYNTGAILTEWMVGKIGISNLISLMSESETIGWKRSFAKYFGNTQESYFDEMSVYLFNESKVVRENRWIMLPQCSSYKTFVDGLCVALNIRRGN